MARRQRQMCIRDRFTVMGKGSVVVMDARKANIYKVKSGKLQSGKHMGLHVLEPGQSYQFK